MTNLLMTQAASPSRKWCGKSLFGPENNKNGVTKQNMKLDLQRLLLAVVWINWLNTSVLIPKSQNKGWNRKEGGNGNGTKEEAC